MSGKLIVFEGTDGSGKATQSKLLFERLQREGVDCRKLNFPRYGEKSAALVELYLGGALRYAPERCERLRGVDVLLRRPLRVLQAGTGASAPRRVDF